MLKVLSSLTAAVRGFHAYRNIWKSYLNETLRCSHESSNAFHIFAIKCERENVIIGHLPREISRPTKHLLDRGATITAHITSEDYRKSPLFEGGLEIKCNVTVTLPATVRGHLLLSQYEELVKELHAEPKEEIIIGSYIARAVLPIIASVQVGEKKKKPSTTKTKDVVKSRDIPEMLNKYKKQLVE